MTDPITRLNAALAGRYRIERELGQGGMATVYLARDEKHNRKVALKVLKPDLAAVVGAERFLAEIETTANLQHPHILPLFDSGEADSFLFYVMPYVEGETLRDRLDREHQLPVDEAVQIAKNVAEALDYAHRHGVIHRDIKPANILLQAGKPVISDFGIALAVGVAGGGRLTETGLSLGTPHYMSPEQATGDLSVGAATDVYALGCVLYEMLLGDPPHTGSTAQAILGKIVMGDADPVTKHRRSVPANVDAAIRKSLEKLPADRFGGAAEFGKALGDLGFRYGEGAGVPAMASRHGLWKPAAVTFAALFALSASALAWALMRPDPRQPVVRQALSTEGLNRAASADWSVALAPDGSSMILPLGRDLNDVLLGLKLRGSSEIASIPGTQNAAAVTYSPDGQWIAYVANNSVFKRPLVGGSAVTLAEDAPPGGSIALAWLDNGTILYEQESVAEPGRSPQRLARIPEDGGASQVVLWGESESGQGRAPIWVSGLPDGRGALVALTTEGERANELHVVDLRDLSSKLLLEDVVRAWYAPTGHVVYVRADGALFAAPFDLGVLEITGSSIPLFDGVSSGLNRAAIHLAGDGTLLYVEGTTDDAMFEFVWVTRSGEATAVEDDAVFSLPDQRANFRLAPDGRRVAYEAIVDGNVDIWVKDLEDSTTRRFTFREGVDAQPVWSPDGESITYMSGPGRDIGSIIQASDSDILTRRTDGAGREVGFPGGGLFPRGWSPDGRWLLLYRASTGRERVERDIFVVPPGSDAEPTALLAREDVEELYPAFSRDGRWIAYVSNETGRREVFVRPFPNVEDGQWQVSIDGGESPVWGHTGRDLFFFDPATQQLKAAQFTTTATAFRRGQVTNLFTLGSEFAVNRLDYFYDVAPGDDRFLLTRRYGASGAPPRVTLVQNFFTELCERMGDC